MVSDTSGRDAGRPGAPSPGLCGACRYGRRIETRRGSVFWRCERSLTEPAYPRYPALPMLRCTGFEPPEVEPSAPA